METVYTNIYIWRVKEREIYILMVPLGPRLLLRTSCKPLAALMFMWRAADLLRTSAFGFNTRSDIFNTSSYSTGKRRRNHSENWVNEFSFTSNSENSLSLSLSASRRNQSVFLGLSRTSSSFFFLIWVLILSSHFFLYCFHAFRVRLNAAFRFSPIDFYQMGRLVFFICV